MKKEKLSLKSLQVQSFVTEAAENSNTVKGGSYTCFPCDEPTDPDPCGTTGCGTRFTNCGGCGGTNTCFGCGGGGPKTNGYSGACLC